MFSSSKFCSAIWVFHVFQITKENSISNKEVQKYNIFGDLFVLFFFISLIFYLYK